MRYGQNRFDASCLNLHTNANNCAGVLAGNPSTGTNTFGGVLLSDFDDPTGGFNNTTSLTCFRDGITGIPGDVGIGGGDSGSSAFLASTNTVLGVALFSSRRIGLNPVPPFGAFGTAFGYACVGRIAGNRVCTENDNFVQSFLTPAVVVPEPSTYSLMATGLAAPGLAPVAVARRNRRTRPTAGCTTNDAPGASAPGASSLRAPRGSDSAARRPLDPHDQRSAAHVHVAAGLVEAEGVRASDPAPPIPHRHAERLAGSGQPPEPVLEDVVVP
jgi:hypothetical protein